MTRDRKHTGEGKPRRGSPPPRAAASSHWPGERIVLEPLGGVWVDEETRPGRPLAVPAVASRQDRPLPLPSPERFAAPPDPRWPLQIRERAASRVALALLLTFGGFLLLTTTGAILFLFAAGPLGLKPAATAELAQKTVVPVIQAVGDVALKLFGNLLAFVLGYYFAKRE